MVGVAESPVEFGLRDSDRFPYFYLPLEQALHDVEPSGHLDWYRTLVVRTHENPASLVPPALRALGVCAVERCALLAGSVGR